jgi:hypothetical protein
MSTPDAFAEHLLRFYISGRIRVGLAFLCGVAPARNVTTFFPWLARRAGACWRAAGSAV